MARDSLTALVALNRFGFGARGGASGDLVNAASDPRGYVKAELSRPNGVLLEMPGLQSTPALAEAVFAYQAEVVARRARRPGEIAASRRPPEANPRRHRAEGSPRSSSAQISRSTASRCRNRRTSAPPAMNMMATDNAPMPAATNTSQPAAEAVVRA